MSLAQKHCLPCEGQTSVLSRNEIERLASELPTGWSVVDGKKLEKEFKFEDFAGALRFTNAVGALSESEGHHPDIYLSWGKVRVTIWTHKVNGLTENDFVLGAKIDELPK